MSPTVRARLATKPAANRILHLHEDDRRWRGSPAASDGIALVPPVTITSGASFRELRRAVDRRPCATSETRSADRGPPSSRSSRGSICSPWWTERPKTRCYQLCSRPHPRRILQQHSSHVEPPNISIPERTSACVHRRCTGAPQRGQEARNDPIPQRPPAFEPLPHEHEPTVSVRRSAKGVRIASINVLPEP